MLFAAAGWSLYFISHSPDNWIRKRSAAGKKRRKGAITGNNNKNYKKKTFSEHVTTRLTEPNIL